VTVIRQQYELEGRLQGVGFRPLVYRLAQKYGLTGSVRNTGQGVSMELQGHPLHIAELESRLKQDLPRSASIRSLKKNELPLISEFAFQIIPSDCSVTARVEMEDSNSAEILPDLAMCEACTQELMDPQNRRYRYAFIQCTDCGPRYSILLKLPFDRANTTMAEFEMCRACREEYQDPGNRRFHAQSICCKDCGPSLYLKDNSGVVLTRNDRALKEAADKIHEGAVVAVLGVGGFHLICDASHDSTIRKLRLAKKRDSKPFALMAPNLNHVRGFCKISQLEEILLASQGAPIVLLNRTNDSNVKISNEVAPGIGTLGVMLPYSPMHRLFMDKVNRTVVATSGNFSEEPICFDEIDALSRLSGMADYFLVHNRKIASKVDDSVVREIAETEVVFRAGRGYAPLVLNHPLHREAESRNSPTQILGMGGHDKNTLAFSRGTSVVLMPHLGNLDSLEAMTEYQQAVEKLVSHQGLARSQVVCDLHPDYQSTRAAQLRDPRSIQIQHHEAHLLSCVAEHGISGEIFGVAWDGTGYGRDGTIWGGEFFAGSEKGFLRTGHLRPFPLPGGEAAIKEPRRTAFGILHELKMLDYFQSVDLLGLSQKEAGIFALQIERGLNSPMTSSGGRLFDAIAALIGIRSHCDYDGQAAIELEYAASRYSDHETYPIKLFSDSPTIVDWEPWIRGILDDLGRDMGRDQIAAKFHRTLAASIVEMAKIAGIQQVALSGGCFQNKILSEWTISKLREEGFSPYWNQRVPPNDGGLSVGQVLGGYNVLVHSC
jgi:hydrogenase maturation protein HypF